jgi:hypothetical protein
MSGESEVVHAALHMAIFVQRRNIRSIGLGRIFAHQIPYPAGQGIF